MATTILGAYDFDAFGGPSNTVVSRWLSCLGAGLVDGHEHEIAEVIPRASTRVCFRLGGRHAAPRRFGHTLGPVVADMERMAGVSARRIHVDRGYRGHSYPNCARGLISGKVRRVTAAR